MTMTPYEVGLLLHVYSIVEEHRTNEYVLWKTTMSDFGERGLVMRDGQNPNGYVITKKGKRLVEMLCDTPDPVLAFVDPRLAKEQP